jgi:hypothetical protein
VIFGEGYNLYERNLKNLAPTAMAINVAARIIGQLARGTLFEPSRQKAKLADVFSKAPECR